MRKKIFSMILILFLMIGMIISLTACEKEEKEEEKIASLEKVVEEYIEALSKYKAKEAIKYIDPYGGYVLYNMDEDDYEDFWKEYQDFLDGDEYEEYQEQWEEELKDKNIEYVQDDLDYWEEEEYELKLNKVVNSEKVGKNLYKVKVKVQTIYNNNDKDTESITGYIMKKGSEYYIIGGELDLFTDYYSYDYDYDYDDDDYDYDDEDDDDYDFDFEYDDDDYYTLDELEISQFNQSFTNYRGRQLGVSVTNLLDRLIANATTYSDVDEKLPDLVYFDDRTTGAITDQDITNANPYVSSTDLHRISDDEIEAYGLDENEAQFQIISTSNDRNTSAFSDLRAKISEKHYYQVELIEDDQTGLIKGILISY